MSGLYATNAAETFRLGLSGGSAGSARTVTVQVLSEVTGCAVLLLREKGMRNGHEAVDKTGIPSRQSRAEAKRSQTRRLCSVGRLLKSRGAVPWAGASPLAEAPAVGEPPGRVHPGPGA